MDLSKYGPFANVVAMALALVATFSVLLLKMFGSVKRWTWLTSGAPPFLVTVPARMVSIALMAVTYITISKSNYGWFAAGAILFAILGLITIVYFDRMRERHVVQIPLVGHDGKPLLDRRNRPVQHNLVVGLEANLRDDTKAALSEARKKIPGLSVRRFMSGFGGQINDPELLWDPNVLANTRSTMTMTLMAAVLFGVMTLFLAAFVIDVYKR